MSFFNGAPSKLSQTPRCFFLQNVHRFDLQFDWPVTLVAVKLPPLQVSALRPSLVRVSAVVPRSEFLHFSRKNGSKRMVFLDQKILKMTNKQKRSDNWNDEIFLRNHLIFEKPTNSGTEKLEDGTNLEKWPVANADLPWPKQDRTSFCTWSVFLHNHFAKFCWKKPLSFDWKTCHQSVRNLSHPGSLHCHLHWWLGPGCGWRGSLYHTSRE